ncbi:e01fdeda-3911-423f-b986-aadd20886541 [Sclerotinia trifoliorum]|uniref:E01fdeda-3911-423f-b986-aadd20886541 n=1 Tax=Sclerotinia trifoliorum TaxID=28548 RepID=A0A8H2VZR3_9HELO|nr:e01fdeda-3911-423f-b986-aadd20886541 [Sclerotinia trifoliorum]
MPPIKLWNAFQTLDIKTPTNCQWEINHSPPTPDSCLRILNNPKSRNNLLSHLEFSLPSEALHHLENLAAQSLCSFCGSREERLHVIIVSWKLKMNEVLSLRLRFYADQETALLDMQEEVRGNEEVLIGRVKVAEVKYETEVKGHEVSRRTIQNLLEKVEFSDLKYEREVQQYEISKRTIRELLEKLKSKDTELSNQSNKFDDKISKLSEEINSLKKENIRAKKENDSLKKENNSLKKENDSLKKENIRLRDQRASMQSLWQRRCANHNQEINTFHAVVKTFVATQQKLADKWAASDAVMDLEFKEYLLDPASGVQEGVTSDALSSGSGPDSSDGMVETPPAKKRKFQASVADCKDC